MPTPPEDKVARPRVELALAAALMRARLVLLVAPAGFGKTVALSTCLHQAQSASHAACLWISADEDDDLPRIAACAVAALEPFKVPWQSWVSPKATAQALSDADPARRRSLANAFVNALEATPVPRGLIVIDDAHRLADVAIFQFLDHMVERLPAHWGIVLASREDPPMAIARWRGRGVLEEFRQPELRFELDEVRALVGDTSHAPAALQPEALLQRTGGWAVGLRMALQARSAGGALHEHHVFDYVVSEVLAQMPTAKRRFLLHCSLLPELHPQRCALVTGDTEVQARRWLEEIEAQGLFVSARGGGGDAVLVMHDLFRGCLEHLLVRECGNELPQLLRRTAHSEPDALRRVGLLLRAGAADEARDELLRAAPALITAGVVRPLQRLIDQFPLPQRDSPELQLVRGWIGWSQWDFEVMRVAMHQAHAGFASAGQAQQATFALAHEAVAVAASRHPEQAQALLDRLAGAAGEDGELQATVLHAQAWQALECGPLDEVCVLMERELELIERAPSAVRWYKASPTIRYLGLPGASAALRRYVEGATACIDERLSGLRVFAALTQGWVEVWAGRVEAGEPMLQLAIDDCRWLDQASLFRWEATLVLAVAHALRGEGARAIEAFRRLTFSGTLPLTNTRRKLCESLTLVLAVQVAAAVGDHASVREAHERLSRLPEPPHELPFAAHRAALAGHAALANGCEHMATVHWRQAMAREGDLRMFGLDSDLRVRLADVAARNGQLREAATWLRPALARVSADAALAPVLMLGAELLGELARQAWGPLLSVEELQLLQSLHRRAPVHQARAVSPEALTIANVSTATPAQAQANVLNSAPDPALGKRLPQGRLTRREAQILQRLAAGDSNKAIARAFQLSPHTVKRHVANILGKLRLSSRREVAAWFHRTSHC